MDERARESPRPALARAHRIRARRGLACLARIASSTPLLVRTQRSLAARGALPGSRPVAENTVKSPSRLSRLSLPSFDQTGAVPRSPHRRPQGAPRGCRQGALRCLRRRGTYPPSIGASSSARRRPRSLAETPETVRALVRGERKPSPIARAEPTVWWKPSNRGLEGGRETRRKLTAALVCSRGKNAGG